jgi:hypothetical protein
LVCVVVDHRGGGEATEGTPCGPDPDRYVEGSGRSPDAGFDEVAISQLLGPGWLLPLLRARAATGSQDDPEDCMRAVTWQGVKNVRVEDVADPIIKEPTDAVVEITSTAICGSDLHLYRPLAPFMEPGDILGHEPMGRVAPVGDDVRQIAVGDQP